jgi:glycosyltransferase involved in cell wall biosynthesis
LVPPGDPVALGAAIDRVLDDEALGARLGRAAASTARERFSVERMGAQTLTYLDQVLAAS